MWLDCASIHDAHPYCSLDNIFPRITLTPAVFIRTFYYTLIFERIFEQFQVLMFEFSNYPWIRTVWKVGVFHYPNIRTTRKAPTPDFSIIRKKIFKYQCIVLILTSKGHKLFSKVVPICTFHKTSIFLNTLTRSQRAANNIHYPGTKPRSPMVILMFSYRIQEYLIVIKHQDVDRCSCVIRGICANKRNFLVR